MPKYSPSQIKDIVNTAYNQMTGKTEVTEPLDLTAFTDKGSISLADNRDAFTGALISVCTRNWFTDTSYRSEYNDIFYEDFQQF